MVFMARPARRHPPVRPFRRTTARPQKPARTIAAWPPGRSCRRRGRLYAADAAPTHGRPAGRKPPGADLAAQAIEYRVDFDALPARQARAAEIIAPKRRVAAGFGAVPEDPNGKYRVFSHSFSRSRVKLERASPPYASCRFSLARADGVSVPGTAPMPHHSSMPTKTSQYSPHTTVRRANPRCRRYPLGGAARRR